MQETPAGDFVILTFEGDDPEASFAKIMQSMPKDFAEFAMDVHGLDVNAPPPPMPTASPPTVGAGALPVTQ